MWTEGEWDRRTLGATITVGPVSTSVFLFSDIEGSTRLWAEDKAAMNEALERHDRLFSAAVSGAGGVIFKHTGDGLVARFDSAVAAIIAAVDAQRCLAKQEWGPIGAIKPRIGIHAGEAQHREGDWFGPVLNRTARLMAVGHGGQVLVSEAVAGLSRDTLSDDVSLLDLGICRLRDLAEPEHVFQVVASGLSADFGPLRSLDTIVSNLPAERTSFVGRLADVNDVAVALRQQRLVTLTGPGGVGKTRLALHVAAELLPGFSDGVWLCELANVASGGAVDHAVLSALRFIVRPGALPRDALVDALVGRQILLLLDNCEHVLPAVAALAAAVLASCPNVKILATSREPLNLVGEHVWAVEPLPFETDAVVLFLDRAVAARRSFALTAQNEGPIVDICRHLDGVPLAIELAAARLRSLSVEDLWSRLDERFRLLIRGRTEGPSRQATLRAAVDWSYELLSPAERKLFNQLSVFAGSFDLPAASAVASDVGGDDLDVLNLLSSLVDKSMVQLTAHDGGARYLVLETLRQYGAEQLRTNRTDQAVAQRHAEYYATLVGDAAVGLRGPDEGTWAEALDTDFDNLRQATRWAIDQRRTDLALRVTAALWTYPIDRMVLEPAEWAERTLELPGADEHPLSAQTHITAGWGAHHNGRYDDALRHAELAIAIAERHSDPHLSAALGLGISGAAYCGRPEAANFLQRIIPCARDSRDDYLLCRALWFPLNVHRSFITDLDVTAAAAECLQLAERVGSPTLLARAHFVNGIVKGANAPTEAGQHFATCERQARRSNARYLIALGIAFSAVAVALADPVAGVKELLRALDWHESTGSPTGITRGALRDMFPAFEELGLHRLIVLLDAHLPPPAYLQPEQAAASAARARDAVGATESERLDAAARAMQVTEMLDCLRREVSDRIGLTSDNR